MKITSVLIVDRIETSLAFWVERLGFRKVVEVPDGDRLGFVILENAGAEVMLQTVESVRKDEPAFIPASVQNRASLFIEVDDFTEILQRLGGYPVAMQDRTTFYGMREIGVFEPGGHIVVFAARASEPQ